jgi:hypothetical protein
MRCCRLAVCLRRRFNVAVRGGCGSCAENKKKYGKGKDNQTRPNDLKKHAMSLKLEQSDFYLKARESLNECRLPTDFLILRWREL